MNIDAMKSMTATQRLAATQSTSAAATVARTNAAVVQPPVQAVREAVQKLEVHMLGIDSALEFRVDDRTHTTVVTVRDKETGEVIRQMPSEEALWLAENLDKLSGTLLSTRA